MNISKVLEPAESKEFEDTTSLKKDERITVQGFKLKHSSKYNSDLVEIQTTDGLRHSYASCIVGQARGKDGKTWWADQVAKCVALDASDGLDCIVVERESNTTGNKMLALETIKPEA